MKAKRTSVEHAKGRVPEVTSDIKETDMVGVTRRQAAKMEQHPDYGTTPTVSTANEKWKQTADGIEVKAKTIVGLLASLDQARGDMAVLCRTWFIDKDNVVAAINTESNGSKDRIVSWGLVIGERSPSESHGAPEDLRPLINDIHGQAAVEWTRDSHVPTYLLQWAIDKDNPATFSDIIACTKSLYRLDGQKSGTTIYFRMQAVDRTEASGRSEWGVWVPVKVT